MSEDIGDLALDQDSTILVVNYEFVIDILQKLHSDTQVVLDFQSMCTLMHQDGKSTDTQVKSMMEYLSRSVTSIPSGYRFKEEYRRPEKGEYWLSMSALILGNVIVVGPHHFNKRKGNWWPEHEPRIILEKVEVKVNEPS